MRRSLPLLLCGLVAMALCGTAAAQAPSPPPVPDASPAASGAGRVIAPGYLEADLWQNYLSRFVTEDGRVVDTANGRISHSEGQGYGMLLAFAANDRFGFERIWGWTRANLMVRGDELMAWKWEPGKRPPISDMNNASDGDILVAWALTEAAEAWRDMTYRVAARRIATEVGRKTILFKPRGEPLLLPGVGGFAAEDRPDGPVVNLSYWVFPAFTRLPVVAPEFAWDSVSRSGLRLLAAARFGPARLPTEWISARDDQVRPADGFPAEFSYNAIRIPLYLAWAGLTQNDQLAPFAALWGVRARNGLPVVKTEDGSVREWLDENGYASLASLVACAGTGAAGPASFQRVRTDENYYPTTLHLLARVAARARFPSCLGG